MKTLTKKMYKKLIKKLCTPYPPRVGTYVTAIKPGSTYDGMVFKWTADKGTQHAFNAAEIRKATRAEIAKARTSIVEKLVTTMPMAAKVTRKEAAKLRSKSWDGADEEAFELLELASSFGRYDMDTKRKLIAKRLRKIAQGPRKWGVLR